MYGFAENVVNLLGDPSNPFVQLLIGFLTQTYLFISAVVFASGVSLTYLQLVIGETPKPGATPNRSPSLAALAMVIIVVGFAGSEIPFKVKPREVGVLLQFGSPQGVLPPGTHSKLPFIQSVVPIEVEERSARFTGVTVTFDDSTRLKTEVTYKYRVEDALQNFIALGGDAAKTDSVLADLVNSVSSQIISNNSLAVLNENAMQVDAELESQMSEAAGEFGVGVSDVRLRVTAVTDGH